MSQNDNEEYLEKFDSENLLENNTQSTINNCNFNLNLCRKRL